jgi:flagellar FliL protein
MADEATVEQLDENTELESKPKKGLSGKKLVLFVVLPLLLILGGGAGAHFMGFLDPILGKDSQIAEPLEDEMLLDETQTVFYELPEMLINLNSEGNRRTNYLKITVALELADDDGIRELEDVMPRIIDSFQVYLRELRIEDLRGSAGLQRLREELLLRVNTSARKAGVLNVLFKEMLIQ